MNHLDRDYILNFSFLKFFFFFFFSHNKVPYPGFGWLVGDKVDIDGS